MKPVIKLLISLLSKVLSPQAASWLSHGIAITAYFLLAIGIHSAYLRDVPVGISTIYGVGVFVLFFFLYAPATDTFE